MVNEEQKIPKKILARQHEIFADYLIEIDKHLLDLVEGRIFNMFEIRDFAEILHIHPRHLSNTIKSASGNSPCFYFEDRILTVSKQMLAANDQPINAIASLLTFDPSNFTKFFKRFTGQTPKAFREAVLYKNRSEKTELLTI